MKQLPIRDDSIHSSFDRWPAIKTLIFETQRIWLPILKYSFEICVRFTFRTLNWVMRTRNSGVSNQSFVDPWLLPHHPCCVFVYPFLQPLIPSTCRTVWYRSRSDPFFKLAISLWCFFGVVENRYHVWCSKGIHQKMAWKNQVKDL